MRDHSAGSRSEHRDNRSGSTSSSDRNSSRDDRNKSSSRQPVGSPDPSTASPRSEASGRTPEVTMGTDYLVGEYEPQQCRTCKNVFSDPCRLRFHSKCTMPAFVDARFVFKCPLCPDQFHTIDDLVVHFAEHAVPRYTCCKCCKKYYTEKDIVTHIRKEHVSVGMLSKMSTGSPLIANQSSRQTHAKHDHTYQDTASTSGSAGPPVTTALRPDPQRRTSGGSLESVIRKAPAETTAAPASSNGDKVLPHTNAGITAQPAAATPAETFEPFSTRKIRVAHTPHSSPKPDAHASTLEKKRQLVSISPIVIAPKYGRNAPVQEPTPLSPIKRAAVISQRRASATESQTGTAASTGLAPAHDPAPPAESKAVSGKTVKPIISESQTNPLCLTPPKADPSVASSSGHSSQMHAEPAQGPVSAPAKRSAACNPSRCHSKTTNYRCPCSCETTASGFGFQRKCRT